MQSFIQNVGEYFVPVLKESNFPTTGRLTPQEVTSSEAYKVVRRRGGLFNLQMPHLEVEVRAE